MLLDAGRTTQALQIAEAASRQHPECLELWQVQLSSPIATNKEKKEWMESALKRALDKVDYKLSFIVIMWAKGEMEQVYILSLSYRYHG